MFRLSALLSFLCFGVYLTFASPQQSLSFMGLGNLPGGALSWAQAVSADGSAVAGFATIPSGAAHAFRWTSATGMVDLGVHAGKIDSFALAISADGRIVGGHSVTLPGFPADNVGFVWSEEEGMVSVGDLAGGLELSEVVALSGDGSVAVGLSGSGPGFEAFRWKEETGIVGIGDIPGGLFHSLATGISSDGTVIVGGGTSGTLGDEPVRWTESLEIVPLRTPGGPRRHGRAWAVSADGRVVVGDVATTRGIEAFRWTQTGGMRALGDLPGGMFLSQAITVSGDGSVILGWGMLEGGLTRSFIWDAVAGMRSFQDALTKELGDQLAGWTFLSALAISADGRTIVGGGFNPQGKAEAWIARREPNFIGLGQP